MLGLEMKTTFSAEELENFLENYILKYKNEERK